MASQQGPAPPPATAYYVALPAEPQTVIVQVQQRRRRLFCCSGACMIVTLVLLLFLLIPRRPVIRYVSAGISVDTSRATVKLMQTFSYFNPNYVAVSWRNLKVDVVEPETSMLVGHGWHNDTFTVKPMETKNLDVYIDIIAPFMQLAPVVQQQCATQGYVIFVSGGTVDAWIWSQHFGTVRVGPFIEQIYC